MKHLKFYVMALLSLVAAPGLVHAQGNAAMDNGKVQAFIVAGNVTLENKDGSNSHPLKRGETFEEGSVVKAAAGSQALLVFSNGATMKVLENCQLSVDQFQQAKFDEQAEGTFLRLSKDPSKSTTQLDLRNGTLQGEVKQLNSAAGSTFTVNTPAGSAGIRGTIVSMSVVRNAAGVVIGITCNCVVGNVAFTPSAAVAHTAAAGAGQSSTAASTQAVTNSNVDSASVGAGAQLVVTLTVDPTTGQISGGGITGTAMPTATAQNLADALVETINTAKATVGLAAQPPPVVNVTTAPVVTTSTTTAGGGTTTSTTTAAPITNVTFSAPVVASQTSGDATITASPQVTVVTTPTAPTSSNPTTTPTAPPPTTTTINTNPSTVSSF